MNFLSRLPKIISKRKKRLGRGLGSNKGAKSGRGTTRHQKARENIPLHFEGGQGRMVKRYPLLRGKSRNKSRNPKAKIVLLEKLNLYEDGAIVDYKSLLDKRLIKKDNNFSVKILFGGELKKKLTCKVPASKTAKAEIEKLGGKVEV